MEMKTLTEAEEAIMYKIWEFDAPVTSSMILEAFRETRGWKTQTISTFLSRLVDKRYLSVKKQGMAKGAPNEYRAIISREEYGRRFAREMIEKIYGGSVKELIASFVESDSISTEEFEELKKWFSERKLC